MSDHEPLPEHYLTDDRPPRRISAPTYEALAQCQIIMIGENNIPGPTLIEPGEHFTTESIPNHQWMPLNRAAGERFDIWVNSLPTSGTGLNQAEITEAAYAMRPREGEPEIPHEQWWSAVMKYAAAMKDKRAGNTLRVPQPAQNHRAGGAQRQVMPFTTAGSGMPVEPGRAPPEAARQQPTDGARRARPGAKAPLANANPTDSVAQTAT